MRKWLLSPIILLIFDNTYAQQSNSLSVEKIMRDPKWIGSSPDKIFWGTDNKTFYFDWNPENATADSLYAARVDQVKPVKTPAAERALIRAREQGVYNRDKTMLTYSYNGDIYLLRLASNTLTRITSTTAYESNPLFSFGEKRIVYQQGQNLYSWDIAAGLTEQLTNFQRGSAPSGAAPTLNEQEKWLQNQQMELMQVLKEAKARKDSAKAFNKAHEATGLRTLYTGDKTHENIVISPDGRFITYRLYRGPTGVTSTIVPSFVTESGFTEDISARTKVGAAQGTFESYVYDRQRDTVILVKTNAIPGINDQPDYLKDYTKKTDTAKTAKPRSVRIQGPYWSDAGTHAIADVRSADNKDRWIMLLQPASGQLKLLNRQRDEAWIAGPGINGWGVNIGWIDENTCWYQSEVSGYSHLYVTNVNTGQTKALTSGKYEVQDVWLSNDKRHFYIVTNEPAPGEKQLYRLSVDGSKKERITQQQGAHEIYLSPDQQWIAYRYSYSNKPWELFLLANKPNAQPVQVTEIRHNLQHFAATPGATRK